jgi:hypothetical protein
MGTAMNARRAERERIGGPEQLARRAAAERIEAMSAREIARETEVLARAEERDAMTARPQRAARAIMAPGTTDVRQPAPKLADPATTLRNALAAAATPAPAMQADPGAEAGTIGQPDPENGSVLTAAKPPPPAPPPPPPPAPPPAPAPAKSAKKD